MSKSKTDSVNLARCSGVQARAALEAIETELLVSPRVQVGALDRLNTLRRVQITDVFLLPAIYSNEHRRKENFLRSSILCVEFDDHYAALTCMEQIEQRAVYDATRATEFMAALSLSKVNTALPKLVVFSGRKSVHCLFFLSRPLRLSEMILVQDSARIFIRRRSIGAGQATREESDMLGLDLSVFASPTAICRLPNDSEQNGRLPQTSWLVNSGDAIDVAPLLSSAMERAAEDAQEKARPCAISALRRRFAGSSQQHPVAEEFSRIELGTILRQVSDRPNGAFSCCCPIHNDEHPSALVASNGFIYCSVCCSTGQSWVARVRRSQSGALEVLSNEK